MQFRNHTIFRNPSAMLFTAAVTLCLAESAVALPSQLVGYDPSGQIRFRTPAEADAKRQELISYIWTNGLPTNALPSVTTNIGGSVFSGDLSGLDGALAASVDRLDADVAPYDFHGISYLVHPLAVNGNNRRMVMLNSGHRADGAFTYGVNDAANRLLSEGFNVMMTDMPVTGFNADNTILLPNGGGTVTISGRGTAGHGEMFDKLTNSLPNGTIFRLFLEPMVQGVNYFLQATPDAVDVSFVGLSGGGWTCHLVAALDTRFKQSFAVAGSYPRYIYGDVGTKEPEQWWTPLYREIDTNGDGVWDMAAGVASYLEIFALGGYGPGRRQIQILNFYDSCCFAGDAFVTYTNFVSNVVRNLGQGAWDFYSDTSHNNHWISSAAINNVIMPGLGSLAPPGFVIKTAYGNGADCGVNANYGINGGQNGVAPLTEVMWSNANGTSSDRNCKSYFRFDLSQIVPGSVTAASLTWLSYRTQSGLGNCRIWGLNNGDPGENWGENVTSWTNAPGLNGAVGDAGTDYVDPSKVTRLSGSTALPSMTEGEDYTLLSGAALVNFLNTKTNGVVTIFFDGYSSSGALGDGMIATKEATTLNTYNYSPQPAGTWAPYLWLTASARPAFTSNPILKLDVPRNQLYSDTLTNAARGPTNISLIFAKVSGPAWLAVAADGTVSGTPGTGDSGTNSWTLSVSDGVSATNTTVLIIKVGVPPSFVSNPIFNGRILKPDALKGQPYSGTLTNVALNPESGAILFGKVSGPAWLAVGANGALSGTPGVGDLGINSWNVSVADGAYTNQAVLQISVVSPLSAAIISNPGFEADVAGSSSVFRAGPLSGWTGYQSTANYAGMWDNSGGTYSSASGYPMWTGTGEAALIAVNTGQFAGLFQYLGTVTASDVGKTFKLGADLSARNITGRSSTATLRVAFATGTTTGNPGGGAGTIMGTAGTVSLSAISTYTPVSSWVTTNATFTPGLTEIGKPIFGVIDMTLTAVSSNSGQKQYLADNVTLTVHPAPSKLTWNVSGGSIMTLSWSAEYLGWILQTQTNALNVGLSTNWTDIAGSDGVTSTNLAILPQTQAAYYRLRHP